LSPQIFAAPKHLAKNAEKCAIHSFFKAEDDPTTMDNFHQPFNHNKSGGLWLSMTLHVPLLLD